MTPRLPDKKPISSKAERLLGTKDSSRPPELAMPDYLTIYLFNGTASRAGVGHIAWTDQNRFYSYEASNPNWVQDITLNNTPDRLANYHVPIYGTYQKIILPRIRQFDLEYKSFNENFPDQWLSADYSFFNKNCAHMVEAILMRFYQTKKIPGWLIPTAPSEIAAQAQKMGMAIVRQIIRDASSQQHSREQQDTFTNFLFTVQDKNNDISTILYNETLTDKEKFFAILKELAKKHYHGIHENDFLFQQALTLCPISNYRHTPQSFSEKYPYLKAVGRALVGVIAATPLLIMSGAVVVATSVAALALMVPAIPILLVTFLFLPTGTKDEMRLEINKKESSWLRNTFNSAKEWYYQLSNMKKLALCLAGGTLIVAAGLFTGGAIYGVIAGMAALNVIVGAVTFAGMGYLAAGGAFAGVLAMILGIDMYKYSMYKPKHSSSGYPPVNSNITKPTIDPTVIQKGLSISPQALVAELEHKQNDNQVLPEAKISFSNPSPTPATNIKYGHN